MKAITIVNLALRDFQEASGMVPKVILLPRRVFQQFESEQGKVAGILNGVAGASDTDEANWVDVRVVEHEGIEEVEVY